MKKEIMKVAGLLRKGHHFLVVGGNVDDTVMVGKNTFSGFTGFLANMTTQQYENYVTYDVFSGLRVVRGEKLLLQRLGLEKAEQPKVQATAKQDEFSKLLAQVNANQGDDQGNSEEESLLPPVRALKRMRKVLSDGGENGLKPTVLVVNYIDEIVDSGQSSKNDLQMAALRVALKELSQDADIRNGKHLIVLVGRHAHELAELLSRPTDAKVIRISKPEHDERLAYAKSLLDGDDETMGAFARVSSGLSFKDMANVVDDLSEGFKPTDLVDACFREKKRVIEEEYGDLLEIIQPKLGFEVIGGLTKVVAEFKRIAADMRAGLTDNVPTGALLAGPPGTGKTLIVEAFAKDAGMNVIMLKDIKSMWLGQSEVRFTRAMSAIREFGPCVVFIDELDQNQGQRGGFDGDNGVSRKLFQKLLKAIEDPAMRGLVFWIGATNRPDLIDGAMMRTGRFSLLVALLPPDEARFADICSRAHLQFKGITSAITDWTLWAKVAREKSYTGSDMVEVVRRAATHAVRRGASSIEPEDMDWSVGDFRPQTVSAKERATMTLRALDVVTSMELLPDDWEVHAREARAIIDAS